MNQTSTLKFKVQNKYKLHNKLPIDISPVDNNKMSKREISKVR